MTSCADNEATRQGLGFPVTSTASALGLALRCLVIRELRGIGCTSFRSVTGGPIRVGPKASR